MKIFKITTDNDEIKLFENPTKVLEFIREYTRDWPYFPEIRTQNLYYYAKYPDKRFSGFKFELYDLTEIIETLEKKLNFLKKVQKNSKSHEFEE